MAQLNHDAESGFLRGESIADEVEQLAQELKLLRAIEANTSDIARRLGQLGVANAPVLPEPAGASRAPTISVTSSTPVAPRPFSPAYAPVSVPAPAVAPAPAGSQQHATPRLPEAPRQAAPASTVAPTAAPGDVSSTRTDVIVIPARDPVSPRQAGTRDESGRFTAKSQPKDEKSTADKTLPESTGKSIGSTIVEAVRDASQKINGGGDNVDPTIQAAKEVSGILSPVSALFKPFGHMFGRNNDAKQSKEHRENITWLRRIWRTQADGNKTKGRGIGGLLGMLLTPLMALLSAILMPLKMLGKMLGMGSLLKAAGGLLGGRGGRRGARGGRGASGRRGSSRGGNTGGTSRNGRNRANIQPGEAAQSRARAAAANARSQRQPGGPGAALEGGSSRQARRAGNPASNAAGVGRTPGSPEPAGAASKAGQRAGLAKPSKLGGLGAMAKGAGGGLMGLGKGLLTKLPLIGALVGAGMVASSAMADDDPDLSPDENKKNKWGNVGGGVGGLVGGALGLFGGPAGAIAGGMLGDMIGTSVGEWLSTVDFNTAIASISTAFSGFADAATKGAGVAFDFIKDGWTKLVTIGSNAISSMADWARDTWKSVTDKVADWKDTAADKVSSASNYVGEKVDGVKDAGANVLYKASGGRVGTGGSAAAKAELIKAMDAGGITDPQSKAMLMANVDHESGGFAKKEENLNYSAKRLQEVFPKYYKNAEDARADAGNPEAIANKVYGNRMGNTEAGDGFKYRGRGALQLTGKAQYEAMGKKLGVDLVNNPELAADPKYSAQIAVQHWKSSGADKAAQAGDVEKARRLTNGGTNGLDDVKAKYEQTYLAQAKAGDLTPTRRADEMRVQAPGAVNTAVASTMATMSHKDQAAAPVGIMATAAGGTATPKQVATITAPTPIGMMAPTQPRGAAAAYLAGAKPVMPLAAGASAETAPAKDPLSAASPTAPAITPIGIMAPTQPRAAAAANSSVPATLAVPKISTYAPAAADASQTRIPATPEVKTPTGSGRSNKEGSQSVTVEVPLSQGVGDRGIAHASSGGLGMFPI